MTEPPDTAFDLLPLPDSPLAPSVLPSALPAAAIKEGRRKMWLVKSRNPVRVIAESLLAGEPIDRAQAIPLLLRAATRGNGFHWREARLAVWTLGFVTPEPEQRKRVTEELGHILKTRSWPNVIKMFFLRWGLLSLPLAVWFGVLGGNLLSLYFLAWFALAALCTIIPVYIITRTKDDYTANSLRAASAQALGRLGLPESVSALAACVEDNSFLEWSVGAAPVVRAAREALPKAIVSLTPQHYLQLDPDIVPNLCRVIHSRDENMSLAALDALGKVGDGRAVATVERFSKRASTPRRRELAALILPVLYFRQQQENSYIGLLRASDAPAADPKTLLRPAAGHFDLAPQQLLRPSAGEPETSAPHTEPAREITS